MTKRYYIDKNGLIVGEVPPEILTPAANLPTTTPHIRQEDMDEEPKGEKTKKNKETLRDGVTWLRKPKKKIVACPICGLNINSSKFKKHLKNVHNNSSAKGILSARIAKPSDMEEFASFQLNKKLLVDCPVCKVKVSSKRLNKHLNKVHNASKKEILNSSGKKVTHNDLPLTTEDKANVLPESFYQDLDEKRDGSKGLGHMRREWDGKFGSFPLHDDYSDESNSD